MTQSVNSYDRSVFDGPILSFLLAASLSIILLSFSLRSQTLDVTFNPGANSTVGTMVVQPDGKIVVGGYFTMLVGQPRNLIGRLNEDGSLDAAFNGGTNFNGVLVDCLAIQPDGKIVVGGDFTTSSGANGLIRLCADGTMDSSFSSSLAGLVADADALCVQTDGRLLVGGYFTSLNSQGHTDLGRLNADGTVDGTFNPSAQVGVYSFAIQPNNNIVVGGAFKQLNGQPRNGIGLLTPAGELVTNFNPAISGTVFPIALQADGQILLGGMFSYPTNAFSGMRRLSADGIVDTNFFPEPYANVSSIAVQVNGGILVAGEFNNLGGQARTGFERLNADGSLDSSINAQVSSNSSVNSVTVQADGKILLGGSFTAVAGQPRQNLARLLAPGASTQTLTFDGLQIQWQRSGPLAECWKVTFAYSTNNSDWILMGAGQRTAGGWQLAFGGLPTNSTLRARGYIPSGYGNGSEWFIQQFAPINPTTCPVILGQSVIWDNGLQFDFNALIGQVVVVETSSDLNHWIPVSTNFVNSVPIHHNGGGTLDRLGQFYRLRLQ